MAKASIEDVPRMAVRIILGFLAVSSLWMLFISLGYLVIVAIHLPLGFGLPLSLRLVGLVSILSGLLVLAWLVRYRRPIDILGSTYLTFTKMIGKTRMEERSVGTEPLVVEGPYRYVRHPLYAGALLLVFGLWLSLDYSPLLATTALFLVWIYFIVTPFEEKELRAIFGQEYERYARQVAKIFPILRPISRRATT